MEQCWLSLSECTDRWDAEELMQDAEIPSSVLAPCSAPSCPTLGKEGAGSPCCVSAMLPLRSLCALAFAGGVLLSLGSAAVLLT